MGRLEVLLTVINWNYKKICDNLSVFKIINTRSSESFFSQKKLKYQCMIVHLSNFPCTALTVQLPWNSWNLGLLIANLRREFCYTMEPPCANTSCKRPPPISDRQSKLTKIFRVKALELEPLVNNHLLSGTATTFWA